VTKTRELLGESLHLLSYATALKQEADVPEYVEMIARVERRITA